jgi:hypothetical protein
MVLSRAVPSEPPICWVVLTRALATPASWLPTPISAVLDSGMKTAASPRLIRICAGSTWLT